MTEVKNSIDRRKFIRTTCAACAASYLALTFGCKSKSEIETGEQLSEKEAEAVEKMIAICGLNCAGCEAYIATQANDEEAKAAVAKKWTEYFGAEFTPETVTCDGCTTKEGRLSSYADGICEIRTCGLERKVVNCAHCEDYVCEKLAKFFEMAPEAKKSLEEIRKNIQ